MDGTVPTMSFIVRVSIDPAGQMAGTVELVRTGEKQRFDSVDAIAAVIARMITAREKQQQG